MPVALTFHRRFARMAVVLRTFFPSKGFTLGWLRGAEGFPPTTRARGELNHGQ